MLEVENDVESGIESIQRGGIGFVTCVRRAYFTGGIYISAVLQEGI
jgi:hypothetical protein